MLDLILVNSYFVQRILNVIKMQASSVIQSVILTGMPGIGKTTLIKAVGEEFQKQKIQFCGFYTEEVRNAENKRIGFDVVTFNGNRSILARHYDVTQVKSPHRVGQYNVHLGELEKMVKLTFRNPGTASKKHFSPGIIIVDEVGSMELMSNDFRLFMIGLINDVKEGKRKIIVTIPMINRRNDKIIEDLKRLDNSNFLEVTKENRSVFQNQFLEVCLKLK